MTPATPDVAPPEGRAGLTSAEARERLARHGPNLLVPGGRRLPAAFFLLRALVDPMVALLLLATPTYLALGDYEDAAVTAAAIAPIAAVNLVLERRAERALEALRRLASPVALAWRDAQLVQVPIEEVVPGDLLLATEGDLIAADGELVNGLQLTVDESALTGESLPVHKSVLGAPEERRVFAGTSILAGRGAIRVTETGALTRFGRVGTLVAAIKPPSTPLQRLIRRLFRQLAVLAAVVCIGVAGIQLAYGEGLGAAIIVGVSLAIAAIPEELPMVYTLYLGLGAWRLARENALVRRLAGVETLGATTVICTDKTGTLTMGHLEVFAVATQSGVRRMAEALNRSALELVLAALRASEPAPYDPLEKAIWQFATAHGLDGAPPPPDALVADYPFDTHARYMSHVWQLDGRHRAFAKGALEGMLEVSRATDQVRRWAHGVNAELAADGMRVIAVAAGDCPDGARVRVSDEQRLEFLGLIAFSDPVRPGVKESLAECQAAGIRVVMITGDHQVTAHAVAESLGLEHDDHSIATGHEIDILSPEELGRRVHEATIFARTRPEQKYALVRALKAGGETVAMTGDGINDAPALREADIGVAMGLRGTQVAREAATLVLLDDNFATVVGAVRDGRRIFENLRRAVTYLIGFHVPLLLAAALVPLTGQPLFLLPVHLILLELILHPTISLVFESDPPPEDLMRRPPRPRSEGLLRRRDIFRPLATGLTLSAGVIALYLAKLAFDASEEAARGSALAALILGQTLMLLVERSPERPVWRGAYHGNRTLLPVIAATVALVAAVLYVPGLSTGLHLEPPGLAAWPVVVAVAAVTTLWFEPLKPRVARAGKARTTSLAR